MAEYVGEKEKLVNIDEAIKGGKTMTIEEAIYCLKSYMPDAEDDMCKNCRYYGSIKDGSIHTCKSNTAREMAIEALKKQMPRKPIKHDPLLSLFYRCPSCDNCLADYIPRCIMCGQAIDWKEIKITESV